MGRAWWVAAGLLGPGLALAQVPCPPGLLAAAQGQGRELARAEEIVRKSTLASPAGIEDTVQFDLSIHSCHRGPGHAYREHGAPECQPPEADGRVPVRYPFRLHYRQALTLEALFAKPWKEGSPGILQVTFEPEGDRWIPVARRELLDLSAVGAKKGSGAGHPAAKP